MNGQRGQAKHGFRDRASLFFIRHCGCSEALPSYSMPARALVLTGAGAGLSASLLGLQGATDVELFFFWVLSGPNSILFFCFLDAATLELE